MFRRLKRWLFGDDSSTAGVIPPATMPQPQPEPEPATMPAAPLPVRTPQARIDTVAKAIIKELLGQARGLPSGAALSYGMTGPQAALPTERLAQSLEIQAGRADIKITSVSGFEVNAVKL